MNKLQKFQAGIQAHVPGLIEEALLALSGRGRPTPHWRNTTAQVYLRSWVDFSLFLELRAGELSAYEWSSRSAHKGDVTSTLDRLVLVLPQVERRDIEEYQAALLSFPTRGKGKRQVGLSASTVNRHLAALKFLFECAIRRGVCTQDPTALVRRRKGKVNKRNPLTQEQIKRILATFDSESLAGVRNRMIVLFIALTGARREEVCSLRLEDLDFDENGLMVTLLRKGGEKQTILASVELEKALAEYLQVVKFTGSSSPVFPLLHMEAVNYSTVPMSPNRITKIMHTASEKALKRKVGPHALRHAFITTALNNGAPLQEVQEYVGHSDPGTTMTYFHSSLVREHSAAEYVSLKGNPDVNQ